VFITGLISIPVFLLGVEMLYRGAKFSSPYLIALASVFPELILTLQASLRSNYYVALSGVLSSIASLYVIGVVMFGTIYFLRWKKDMVVGRINDYNFVIVSSVMLTLMGITGRLNLFWGVAFIILFLFYSIFRVSRSWRVDRESIIPLVMGVVLIWFSSNGVLQDVFSASSALHVPPYYMAVLIIPIASNLQEIYMALRTRGENAFRNMLTGVINESILSSTLLLSVIGLASGTSGIELSPLVPLVGFSILTGAITYLSLRNGTLRPLSSIFMILGLVLFFSVIRA
jgi:cation:H+ antiporter